MHSGFVIRILFMLFDLIVQIFLPLIYFYPFSVAVPNHVVVNVNLVVVVQSSVILPCHVEPDESIEFTWTKDGVSLSLPSPGYQLLSNGSIFIQAVAVSQEGVYVCTASNSAGSSEGTVDLTIQGTHTKYSIGITIIHWNLVL